MTDDQRPHAALKSDTAVNSSKAINSAPYRLHLSVGVLSVAIIAFELVLIQILSTVQWYHFAYMVISVALLGFGASGTLIALARSWLLHRFEVLAPLLMIASGAAMAAVVALSQTPVARW